MLARLLIALPLVAWACAPPGSTLEQRLLDSLEGTVLSWEGALVPQAPGRLLEVGESLEVELDLGREVPWRELPADSQSAGGPTGELRAWRAPVTLPTPSPRSVRLLLGESELPVWRQGSLPERHGVFYSPGDFLTRGLYLALPPGETPPAADLRVRFRPGPSLLARHLAAAGRLEDAALLETRVALDGESRPALELPPGASLRIPLQPGPPGVLHLAVGLRREPWQEDAPTGLRLGLASPGDDPEWLREEAWETGAARGWRTMRVTLPRRHGSSGLLLSRTGGPVGPSLYLGDPVVTRPEAPSDPRNLIVVVVDGLRADRVLGPDAGDLTPHIQALAARGLGFSSARVAAPWTRPSIASIFTGTLPSYHGVETEGVTDVLPAVVPTLPELLRREGYATLGVSANMHLAPAFGLQRGFGRFRAVYEDGRKVLDRGLAWLQERPHDPFLLFLFFMDTHHPFRHRPGFDRSSHLPGEAPDVGRMGSRRLRHQQELADPGPAEVAKLTALYDENVAYVDALLGELAGRLEALGLDRRTVVLVTADHGEALGEHGDYFHGWNLFEELVHVPLVLAGPGVPRGERVTAPVSLVELPGTLLALCGLDPGGLAGKGRVLLPPVEPGEAPPLVSESRFRDTDLASLLRPPYKAIWRRSPPRHLLLFDLQQDPGEMRDLAHRRPELAKAMRRRLAAWLEKRRRARPETGAPAEVSLDPETLESLRALGYVQ